MAGDQHQLTILGFPQPQLQKRTSWSETLGLCYQKCHVQIRAILGPLSSVRSGHSWSTGSISKHHRLRRTLTNWRKSRGEQQGWGVEEQLNQPYHCSFVLFPIFHYYKYGYNKYPQEEILTYILNYFLEINAERLLVQRK